MRNYRVRHVGFWVVYLLFEAYVEYSWMGPSFGSLSVARRIVFVLETELAFLPVKAGLVYFLFFLYFPKDEQSRPVWQLIAATVVAFLLAVIGRRLILVYINIPIMEQFVSAERPQRIFEVPLLNSSFIELLFVSGIATSIKAFRQQLRLKEREKNLLAEKLESELRFLKTQINPHFLFNSLNTIYALARKQSALTSEAVMKLSKLMRFMLYETNRDRISLMDELLLIGDYIELERFRYNDRLGVDFNYHLDNPGEQIAPLLLIHFVENAFKHGASESRFGARISISVNVKDHVLKARISNTTENSVPSEARERIGLENIRRQLQLVYPDHQLQVEHRDHEFVVDLTINLQ